MCIRDSIIGALNGLLIVLKGLPLAYGKDMQEDKEGVFDAADSLGIAIAATTGMLADMTANPAAMRAALATGFPTATDLADYLVRELGLPFREAHHVSGTIVAMATMVPLTWWASRKGRPSSRTR